jgi:outer membrane receptor for ferric coprogen and ferric-rhodotorulic acid
MRHLVFSSPSIRTWLRRGVAVLALLALTARGQVAPTPVVSAADLARYDRNHDNRLDAAELAARDADRAAARSAAPIPAAATASTSDGEVVELSPFEVSAGDDTGYFASNTLSGTRINSKIEDLASSITVVTKQQLLDTAAVDINDIFLYEANTEGTGTFTDFSVGRNGDVNDAVQSSPETANRIRGIGAANVSRGNFASDSRIPIDTFNVDAVEISRGPNSNIFGLGNASGTVNVIKSQASLQRDKSDIVTRADSYGGYRVSVDFNRVLKKDKLGVRVLGLYDSVGYVRKPSADLTHRLEGMITWRPFKNMTLRADYQSYHNYARRPNSLTPRDTVSYWRASGSPTWDPVTASAYRNGQLIGTFPQSQDANLPAGLFSQGTGFYNRPGMFYDQGQVAYWSVNRTTSTANANSPNTNVRFLETGTDIMRLRGSTLPLFVTPGVTDQSLYDWTSVNYVAPNYGHKKADIYNVELDQFFLNTPMHLLAAQAGWYREDVDEYSRNFISGNSSVLFVDPNRTLLDGSPNPFYLRPYIGASEPTTFSRPSLNDNGRAQLAYQLDLTKSEHSWLHWFGRHRASGYLEGRRITSGLYRFREIVLDNHTWVNPANRANGNAANRAYFKYYLGDNRDQNIDYAPPSLYGVSGTYNFHWLNGTTGQWVSEPATIGQAAYISNRTQREIRSRGAVLQSFWFDERIVTTVGTRRDKNRSRDSNGATIDPATGLYSYAPLDVWRDWQEQQGTTSTRGIVVKPFRNWRPIETRADKGSFFADALRGMSFFYNKSNTFQPAAAAYNLFGELLPNPVGVGKDYGFNLSLLHNKLAVRVDRYDTAQRFSRGGDAGIVATRANRLDFGGDGFNLEDRATEWVAQLHPELNATQQRSEVYKIMGLPGGFIENMAGKPIAETQDVSSRGWEFEVNYNPTSYWTMKLAGAQQQTIDSNLSPNIQRYLDTRLPVWQSIVNPVDGTSWWTTRYGSAGTPQSFYEGAVLAPYKLATANQGKPRSQVREWSWNLSTSFNLSGLHTDHRWMNGTTLGGSVRWQDRGSIGFLGAAPDASGIVRAFDPGKPVYDSSHTYVDLFASRRFRFNHFNLQVQLNVRNVFEDGRLQTIGVNPDGTGYNFRIVDPRQFILTATFQL